MTKEILKEILFSRWNWKRSRRRQSKI